MTMKPIDEDAGFLRRTISDLTEQIDLLTLLHDLSREVVSRFDFNGIIEKFMEIVREVVNYEFCILYLRDKGASGYRVAGFTGIDEGELGAFRPDDEIIAWVLKEGRWTPLPDGAETVPGNYHSILPLRGVKADLGFLFIAGKAHGDAFNKGNMTILSFIADQTGIALENQNLYAQLSRSRNYIHNIMESINNGIVALDRAGRITLINKNATAMLGMASADIIGNDYRETFHPGLVRIMERLRARIVEQGFAIETRFEHAPFKGFVITLGITAAVLTDEKNLRIGIIFVLRDMSASMEIQRLTRLDELKSEFVSNVSHELRTPLSIIKSYVEALRDQVDPDDRETHREFITVVNDETDRLAELVADLLDISRIESGKFEMTMEPVDLGEIARTTAERFRDKRPVHRIKVHAPPHLPELYGDRDKLTQVLINLTGNAIKFSPEGGEVEIRLASESEHLLCSVADPGIGISEEEIPRIFEKFYRVDNSDTYEIPGTGLGLPIVKHIVESHGGTVSVTAGPAKGSVFTLSFPIGEGQS